MEEHENLLQKQREFLLRNDLIQSINKQNENKKHEYDVEDLIYDKKKKRYFHDNPFKLKEEEKKEEKVDDYDIQKLINSVKINAERKIRNSKDDAKIIVSFDGKAQIYNIKEKTVKKCDELLQNYKPFSVLVNIDNDVIFSCGGVNKSLYNEPRIDECFYYTYDIDLKTEHNPINVRRLEFSRSHHTAIKIDRKKIFVAGGYDQPYTYYSHCEIVDLDNPNMLIRCGHMQRTRYFHTSNLITTNSIIICGGRNNKHYHNTSEIYNTELGEWKEGPLMNQPRSHHSSVVLNDSRLMIFGGCSNESLQMSKSSNSTEFYDHREGKFQMGPQLPTPRFGHFSTLLNDGNVLLGGCGEIDSDTKTTKIFDPKQNKFQDGLNLEYDFKFGSVL